MFQSIISTLNRARRLTLPNRKSSKNTKNRRRENVLIEPEKVEPYGADAVKENFPPEAVVFPATTERNARNIKTRQRIPFSRHGARRRRRYTAALFRLTAVSSLHGQNEED
jgi:hypothetical protein